MVGFLPRSCHFLFCRCLLPYYEYHVIYMVGMAYIGTNVCTFLFSMPTLFVMRVFVRLNYTGRERKTYNIMFYLMRDEKMLHQLNTFFFLNSVANITKYGKSLLGMTTKPNLLEGLIILKADSIFFLLNCN